MARCTANVSFVTPSPLAPYEETLQTFAAKRAALPPRSIMAVQPIFGMRLTRAPIGLSPLRTSILPPQVVEIVAAVRIKEFGWQVTGQTVTQAWKAAPQCLRKPPHRRYSLQN